LVYLAAACPLRASKGKRIAAATPQERSVRDDPYVVALVSRAGAGDEGAWDEIVDRYAPLVWSICARYRLSAVDIEDVGQTIWAGLVKQLGKLREPAALPGWLSTTTRRECLRVLRESQRFEPFGGEPEDSVLVAEADPELVEEEILKAERHARLRAALAELPEESRRLLTLLASDPPLSYAEISTRLGIPPGSIGPMRGRLLDRLRRSAPLAGLSDTLPEGHAGSAGASIDTGTSRHPVPAQHTVPSGETGRSGAHVTSRRRVR
jgi:RNA polymerase sigma factor (sigma-70 family)